MTPEGNSIFAKQTPEQVEENRKQADIILRSHVIDKVMAHAMPEKTVEDLLAEAQTIYDWIKANS